MSLSEINNKGQVNIKKEVEKILFDSLRIPSYTGEELEIAKEFDSFLKKYNFKTKLIQHTNKRASLIATYGNPKIAFCTHFDTAIKWKEPLKKDNKIFGIGACDAKGSLACQTAVALKLAEEGKPIGIAFLAGEESDSIGALYLKENSNLLTTKYLIHGEPTKSEFVTRTASIVELKLIAKGKKGHSSCRNNEISSIHKLLKALSIIEEFCNRNELIFHIGDINGRRNSTKFISKTIYCTYSNQRV